MNTVEEDRKRLIGKAIAEVKQLETERFRVRLEMPPMRCVELVASLQLAMRHPEMPESQRARLQEFVEVLIRSIPGDCHALRQFMALGEDKFFAV